jgi:hypothetical protein
MRLNRRSLAVVIIIGMASALVVRSQERDLLIVGDLSGSVKGFAKKSPKQMEILYRLLYTSSSRSQFARMPGERDVVQLIPFERVRLFANQNSYTGKRTPLAETIKRATESYESIVIVTDGMESNNLYLQLQDAINPLAQNGWGVWILLLPMSFEGKYDLEQPLNAEENYEDMMNCVREQNPSWSVKIDPLARQTIEFSGERPLLLFVFDRDPEAGRNHVTSLAKSIGDNLKRNSEAVELSPLYLREYQTERVEPTTLGVTVVPDGNVKRVITNPNDGGAQKRLLFHLAWKRSAAQIEQPLREQWTLSRTKRANWANLRISQETDTNKSPGQLSLAVSADLTWSEWFWGIFSSGPVVRVELFEFNVASTLADQPQDGWWNQWNVDTTWRCPQKVFKLKSLIERISGVARERIVNNPPQETTTLKLQIGVS